jgi:hypothetical protein
MVQSNDESDGLRHLVKEAVVEALNEQRGMLYGLIIEALEDLSLVRAIDDGLKTEKVSADEIDAILRSET